MNRIHFRIDDELLSQIEEYMKNNNCTKTKAILNLIELGLEANKEEKLLNSIYTLLQKLNLRINYNRILLEQLYLDLGKEIWNNE